MAHQASSSIFVHQRQWCSWDAYYWSTRTMAAAAGISEASVRSIWRAHGLKPHLVERKPTRNAYLLDSLAVTVKARFPVSVGTPTPADEAEETQRGYHHDGGFGLGDRRDNHVVAE
jgi:hypothetical protein